MDITIHLPPMFRHQTGIPEKITVTGETIGECLSALIKLHPELGEAMMTGDGEIRPGLSVYLNGENAYPDELTKPVCDGDELHIAQMILGG